MQNTTFVLPKRPRFSLALLIHFLFYASILGILSLSRLPSVPGSVFILEKQFLAGHETFFRWQDPGLPYTLFEAYRPGNGRASFLMDEPYDPEGKAVEQFQSAQGRLAPLLLNTNPVENAALFFCSRNEIAQARAQATGYRPVVLLGDGKVIAEKRP